MASSLEELEKEAVESIIFDMDFTNQFVSGESISSIGTVVSTSSDNVSGSSNVTLGTPTFSGNIVQVRISGGTQYEQYTVTITVNTTLANFIQGEGLLRVK